MERVEIHVDTTIIGGVVKVTTADPALFITGKIKNKLVLYYVAVMNCNKRIVSCRLF